MIKYNLKCSNKHEFESWFSNSKEYDKLKQKKLLGCIFCNSKKIEKSIMSPRILSSKKQFLSQNKEDNELKKVKNDLIKLRNFVEKNFKFVGNRLAGEIKDIYYDKKRNKNIYGTTTPKERQELKEEGIDLITIPWIKKDN